MHPKHPEFCWSYNSHDLPVDHTFLFWLVFPYPFMHFLKAAFSFSFEKFIHQCFRPASLVFFWCDVAQAHLRRITIFCFPNDFFYLPDFPHRCIPWYHFPNFFRQRQHFRQLTASISPVPFLNFRTVPVDTVCIIDLHKPDRPRPADIEGFFCKLKNIRIPLFFIKLCISSLF